MGGWNQWELSEACCCDVAWDLAVRLGDTVVDSEEVVASLEPVARFER